MNFSNNNYESKINGISDSKPSAFIGSPENLDNLKYRYIAIRAKGNNFARHKMRILDRDIIFIREVEHWAEPCTKNDALKYGGKLVALSINGMFIIRELISIDFLRRTVNLRLPDPETTEEYAFGMVLKFYVLDAVQNKIPAEKSTINSYQYHSPNLQLN